MATGSQNTGQPKFIAQCASKIQERQVEWLWPNRIPLGKLTVIGGDPKTGKSFLSMYIAAQVSNGSPWPDCIGVNNEPGKVLVLNAEDDPRDTIKPRLTVHGADTDQIKIASGVTDDQTPSGRFFKLDRDLEPLAEYLNKEGPFRLIIIDPLTAYLGNKDGNDNQQVRDVLAPLSKLAEEKRVAIVGITHLNKPVGNQAGGSNAIYRILGSMGIVGAARAVFGVSKDPNDPDRRLFLNIGSNIGKDPGGLAYRLQETAEGKVRVEFEQGIVEMTADEVIGGRSIKPTTKITAAKSFVTNELSGGPVNSKTLALKAKESGFSTSTFNRAKTELGVISEQVRQPNGTIEHHTSRLPDLPPATNLLTPCDDDVDKVENLEKLGRMSLIPDTQQRQDHQQLQLAACAQGA